MITCERCQTENLEGAQYCDECGAALGAAAAGNNAAPRRLTYDDAGAEVMPFAADSGAARRAREAEPRPAVAQSEPRPSAASKPQQAVSPLRTSLASRPGTQVDELQRRSATASAPHAKLVIHRGRSVGKEFPMCEDESHIGRWDADGGIFPDVDLDSDDPEAKVSRRHARITRRNGQYYIEDLGSTNGTFVNRGRRLLPGDRQPLRDGDEVIVGKTFLKFHVLDS
ncbi:MAG TPA: FHA domain-containing protein [Pyrinomonadaceae bacterium]|nr:FHA domain-containing protein [Pyrinomonadaceae bacterium]